MPITREQAIGDDPQVGLDRAIALFDKAVGVLQALRGSRFGKPVTWDEVASVRRVNEKLQDAICGYAGGEMASGDADASAELAAERIARDILGIRSLVTVSRDGQDFHELGAWQLRDALIAAFNSGKDAR